MYPFAARQYQFSKNIFVSGFFLHSLHNSRQETGRKLLNWKEAYLRIEVFKPELQEAVKAAETIMILPTSP